MAGKGTVTERSPGTWRLRVYVGRVALGPGVGCRCPLAEAHGLHHTASASTSRRLLLGTGPVGPRRANDVLDQVVLAGTVPAGYQPELLALREGPLLEAAVRLLRGLPDVLLVDATGRDHPRRAGLAVHLGAVLRTRSASPIARCRCTTAGARRELTAVGRRDLVGYWVCTRSAVRPVVAHAGWRTGPATARTVVLACSSEGARIPAPLGEARRAVREARAIA